MTTINPLYTDVDGFADAIHDWLDTWPEAGGFSSELDDYYLNLFDTAEYIADYSTDDAKVREYLVKLATYAAIIWDALGTTKEKEAKHEYAND